MFYTYELVDPRSGNVFYVGKGCRDRRYAHERDARKGKSGAKCDRIREIIQEGHRVVVRIVERFEDEKAAYAAERELIAAHGADNLTNTSCGGRGGSARPIDPVAIARKTVDRYRKEMRGTLELVKAGYRMMLGPWDLTDCCVAVAESSRRAAGEKYFDKRVWEELSCQLA